MRLSRIAALGAAVGPILLSVVPGAEFAQAGPPGPAGNGRIAYEAQDAQNGSWDILGIQPDGSGPTSLLGLNSPLTHDSPSYSWDGTAMLYSTAVGGKMRVHVLKPGKAVTVVEPGRDAAFLPGDERIVYASPEDGDWEIYAIDLDGTDKQQLTINEVDDRRPSVGPTGMVYFDRAVDGVPQILRMSADGKGALQLTDSGANADPDVARDGSLVVYEHAAGDRHDVYAMDTAGGDPHSLTSAWPAGAAHRDPALSPDGELVAWSLGSGDWIGGWPTSWEIYVETADGAKPKAVTGVGTFAAPDWQPLAIEKVASAGASGGREARNDRGSRATH